MEQITLCIVPSRKRMDGRYRVRVRIYANGTVSYIGTDVYVCGDEWDGKQVIGRSDAKKLNSELSSILAEYRIKAQQFKKSDKTASEIRQIIIDENYFPTHQVESDKLAMLCDTLAQNSDINTMRIELERCNDIIVKLKDRIECAAEMLKGFVECSKMRKKDEKTLNTIIDYLNS